MEHKISIVSCCYNEAENIPTLYDEISRNMESYNSENWSLILIDDGSEDETCDIAHDLVLSHQNVDYIRLSRNYGKEAAISAGLDYAAKMDVNAVILLDSDLQHPIDLIPSLIQKWQEGCDMVVAVPNIRSYSWFNKVMSVVFHRFISRVSPNEVILGGGDFRLMDIRQVRKICLLTERERYMKGLYGYAGGRTETITYSERSRTAGKTSFTFSKRLKLAISATVSLTTLPIRFFTITGLLTLFFAILYLITAVPRLKKPRLTSA